MVVKVTFLSNANTSKVSFTKSSLNFILAFEDEGTVALEATFSSNDTQRRVNFEESPHNFSVSFDETMGGNREAECDMYEGEYAVTPKVKAQRLYTANKHMEEDLIIREIPKYSVTNLAGGETISIASEV